MLREYKSIQLSEFSPQFDLLINPQKGLKEFVVDRHP